MEDELEIAEEVERQVAQIMAMPPDQRTVLALKLAKSRVHWIEEILLQLMEAVNDVYGDAPASAPEPIIAAMARSMTALKDLDIADRVSDGLRWKREHRN